jgi:S-DNA-T family DNA segregation ATPase FtsK/SpoIIIE
MRSSALAGFLASAVFVSGSAGFASTFLVGPYLGEHLRHQPSRATLKATVAPVDPLAALQIPGASVAAGLEGEPPASQKAHRLRNVENRARQMAPVASAPAAPSASDTSPGDIPPVTEEAFAPTAPSTIPAASGGPLIATETTSAMVSSKLENGEPVLTLRIAPVVTASTSAVDATDPDNAVEPTIISAPPSEQALAAPALAAAPVAAPVTAPVESQHTLSVHPRVKPALSEAAPAPVEPAHRAHTRAPAPARVTTVAAPAKHTAPVEAPILPATSDPLNAAFTPSTPEEPEAPAPSPSPAPTQPAATGQPQSTGGPTPLVMPQ